MSRSYRKTPITGWTTCVSEKQDKRLASRAVRSRNRQRIECGQEPLDRRAIRDVATFGKDGKAWCGDVQHTRKHWRK